MEFRILGPLEVVADGEAAALGGVKQRAVLALLLLEAGRVVSTDRLVDALWSGEPPRTAQTSLQNFVSQLRKALGADRIVTRPPGYLLRVGDGELDLADVRALADEARAADPVRRVELLRAALGRWRGAALAELAYEPFAQGEIARLEELRLALEEERVEAELALGRHAELTAELDALVRAHPLRERLRAQQMLALYRSGRQAEALEAYRTARAALVAELGIEPSPLLRGLHASILRQEATGEAPGFAAPPEPEHFAEVAAALRAGRVTVVLAPDAEPLAAELARRFGLADVPPELPRVAQAVATLNGAGALDDALHTLAAAPADRVHRFLAGLPAVLREAGAPAPLLVTLGYDGALEAALREAGEPFDAVTYLASGPHRGRFCHVAADGSARTIERPNAYAAELSARPVVLHLRGRLDETAERAWESFAATEDDFIRYAGRELAAALPVALAARLRRSHFLLLGYALADWTLRAVLERLWGEEPLGYRSWSVRSAPTALERELWRRRGVEVVDAEPERYVDALAAVLDGSGG